MSISDKRLKELENIPDSAIDTSDIPELEDNFWENAKIVKPNSKTDRSISIDEDVLDWFKTQSKDYQSLINTVLRSYINHQQQKIE